MIHLQKKMIKEDTYESNPWPLLLRVIWLYDENEEVIASFCKISS